MKKIKMDLILTNGICSYDLDIIKENISNYYVKNRYGNIYRVNKRYRKVYIGKLLMGAIEYIDIY